MFAIDVEYAKVFVETGRPLETERVAAFDEGGQRQLVVVHERADRRVLAHALQRPGGELIIQILRLGGQRLLGGLIERETRIRSGEYVGGASGCVQPTGQRSTGHGSSDGKPRKRSGETFNFRHTRSSFPYRET